ncbi:MAG: sugar ABC transporter permease [Deltaproteobacteria bacterium]|nr:sugar ABC transporter permease [Deltaproteobacteria bacterium]
MNISRATLAQFKEEKGVLPSLLGRVPFPVWLIIPVEAILLFLMIIPPFISIWLSLVAWQPTYGISIFDAKFVGLRHYINLFTDVRFLHSLLLTFIVTAVCLGVEFLIGLGLALMVYRPMPLRKFFTLVLILPMMFPPLVVGNNFYMMFFAQGPINAMISFILGRPFEFDWLSSPRFAIFPVMLAEIWQWFPLMFLIMLSGLRGLPVNQLRAAEVLGATRWQTFWRIKIRQLVPIILIGLVIRAMEIIKLFDVVYIMTRGGPGTKTETISIFMYKIGLRNFRTDYISAAAWIILITSVILFVILLKPILYKVEKFEEKAEGV